MNNQIDDIDLNELFYKQIGSPSLILDQIYLYFLIPFAFICILLNMFTQLVLQSAIFRETSLNRFIKTYALMSFAICFLIFFKGFTNIPRYLSFSYDYPARFFTCHLNSFLFNSLILYSNFLNIVIIFERLSMFVIRYKPFHIENSSGFSILMFVFSILINMFLLFRQNVKDQNDYNHTRNNLTLLMKLERCDQSQISKSNYSIAGIFIILFIDYILTLVVGLIASFLSIKYYKRYVENKRTVVNLNSVRIWHFDSENRTFYLNVLSERSNDQSLGEIFYESNENLTRFIMNLNIFSVISCIISFMVILTLIFDTNKTYAPYAFLVYDLAYLFKHGLILFILIVFNNHIRKYLFEC